MFDVLCCAVLCSGLLETVHTVGKVLREYALNIIWQCGVCG